MAEFQFESLMAFLLMEPHGVFVWPTYILGVAVLGGLTLMMHSSHRAAIRKIRRQLEREESDES